MFFWAVFSLLTSEHGEEGDDEEEAAAQPLRDELRADVVAPAGLDAQDALHFPQLLAAAGRRKYYFTKYTWEIVAAFYKSWKRSSLNNKGVRPTGDSSAGSRKFRSLSWIFRSVFWKFARGKEMNRKRKTCRRRLGFCKRIRGDSRFPKQNQKLFCFSFRIIEKCVIE